MNEMKAGGGATSINDEEYNAWSYYTYIINNIEDDDELIERIKNHFKFEFKKDITLDEYNKILKKKFFLLDMIKDLNEEAQ